MLLDKIMPGLDVAPYILLPFVTIKVVPQQMLFISPRGGLHIFLITSREQELTSRWTGCLS